jgi:3-oxoacyl-[acyl-carrier protein] reductase
MDLGLAGRVAVVAGASQGLGLASARELAAEGASVVLCARDPDRLERACETIRGDGGTCLGVPADVSQEGAPAAVVARALTEYGRLDVLVPNSGGPPAGRFEELPPEAWDAAANLLLRSAVGFARAALPAMREQGRGRIIGITSVAVKQPVDGLILSNALRAAVTGFLRTLANEVAGAGITVNAVLPGFMATDRMRHLIERDAAAAGIGIEEQTARTTAAIPVGRLGDPREFAAMVVFLASDRASYVTGQSIVVDGGLNRSLL